MSIGMIGAVTGRVQAPKLQSPVEEANQGVQEGLGDIVRGTKVEDLTDALVRGFLFEPDPANPEQFAVPKGNVDTLNNGVLVPSHQGDVSEIS